MVPGMFAFDQIGFRRSAMKDYPLPLARCFSGPRGHLGHFFRFSDLLNDVKVLRRR